MKAIVIAAEAFHLGFAGCYGNDWLDTPNLDRLAAEGVVFDHHYADFPDFHGARQSWGTGQYHFPVPGQPLPGNLKPPAPFLAALRSQNVATFRLIEQKVEPLRNFDHGWDRVVSVDQSKIETEERLKCMLESALQVIESLSRVPDWLIWIELKALLPPWHVPAKILGPDDKSESSEDACVISSSTEPARIQIVTPGADFQDKQANRSHQEPTLPYAAVMTLVDDWLGGLMDELRERRLIDGVAIIFTSDRGFPLGEHEILGEVRPWLHEELVHLPLIVRLPDCAQAGRRVAGLTQPVDLMPTLLHAFGVPPIETHGHSLWPLYEGQSDRLRSYACSALKIGERIEWSLRTPQWAFLLPVADGGDPQSRTSQLFVKPDDRWEVNNLLQHHAVVAQSLEQTLRAFVKATESADRLVTPALFEVDERAPNR